jgi:hypothetical protein
MPSDWAPSEFHRKYAEQHGLDLENEVVSYKGWAEGKETGSWNGTFTTRLANEVKWRAERAARLGKGVVRRVRPEEDDAGYA